jgi:hypothetical protein
MLRRIISHPRSILVSSHIRCHSHLKKTFQASVQKSSGPIRVSPSLIYLATQTCQLSTQPEKPRLQERSMTLETTLSALASCKIEPHGSLSHASVTTDPSSWKSALQEAPSSSATVPSEYKLTKTLVFKPKTAKSAAPTPLILIASEETDTKATNALGKQIALKELRIASDDLIKEFFGVDKSSRECIHLDHIALALTQHGIRSFRSFNDSRGSSEDRDCRRRGYCFI